MDSFEKDLLEIALDGIRDGTVMAIGECGLDRLRENFAPFETQKKVWRTHFDLCERTNLPMFIHSRDCEADTLAMLREQPLKRGGVVHSFDGSLDAALAICQINDLMFIGLNGCSLRTEANLKTARDIPLERILVESDSPWCEIKVTSAAKPLLTDFRAWEVPEVNKPEKLKGQEGKSTLKGRNEPRNTLEVLHVISILKDKPLDEVASVVLANTQRLFGR